MSRPNAAPAFGSFVVSDLNEINFGRPSELADDEQEYDPKVFNLQLLIQKLEEELSVYRNGTTVSQLYEVLQERDEEIKNLRSIITTLTDNNSDLNEKLKRLAKGSAEMLLKNESLQSRNSVLEENVQILYRNIDEMNESKTRLINEIDDLQSELVDRDESIAKLQARCVVLVSEKNEKNKLYERAKADKNKVIKDLRDEIERGIGHNNTLKERLIRECDSSGILSSKLKDANSEIASLKAANNIASTAVDTLRTQLNALVEEKRLANDEVKILKHKLKKYTNCKKETGGVLTDKENIVAK